MTANTNESVAPALPHGELQQVFENLWLVKGQVRIPMKLPAKISRSMTVYRDPRSEALTLINSMRLSESGLAALGQLGKIQHVIRIGGFHGRDDLFYQSRFGATVYAIKGQAYTRAMDVAATSNYMQPDFWVTDASELPINNCGLALIESSKPPEALLLIREHGGVLVSADALHNTPGPDEFVNAPMKVIMKMAGFWKAFNLGPGWLKFAKPDKQDIQRILQLDFNHVLPGHGDPVIGNAKEKYRPVIEQLAR